MAIRAILAAMLVILCMLAGKSAAAAQIRRQRMLEDVLSAIEPLKIRMLFRKLPLALALRESETALFREIGKNMEGMQSAGKAWLEVKRLKSARGEMMDCLQKEELNVLDEFFDQLGISGVREQAALVERTASELDALRQNGAKSCAERVRLYTALGALAGAALAIMTF